jgi:putative restriction endonuclease
MKLYVGVTDNNWYDYLSRLPDCDEVNFWQPSPSSAFRSLKPRLGQGSFRICVTDAYKRSCAVTGERALPVLEAAHIKPFSKSGPHMVQNGLLLRSDLHKLFDKGYMTVTTKLDVEVSRRIKEEFDNGEYYYTLHGKKMRHPAHLDDWPEKKFIEWHNEKVFLG